MRVVGGKAGPDGGLSAFITYVQSGGPADLAGISEGILCLTITYGGKEPSSWSNFG